MMIIKMRLLPLSKKSRKKLCRAARSTPFIHSVVWLQIQQHNWKEENAKAVKSGQEETHLTELLQRGQ